MMRRERMSSVDLAWLRMERPTNLMVIVGVDIFKGPVNLDHVVAQWTQRITAYRRVRQRVEVLVSGAYWVDDPNFDLVHHIQRVRLPGGGGKAELQRLAGELAGTPLDFAHPLWQVHFIEDYEGGAAAVIRIHHCIADGVALIRVMLSLADNAPAAAPDADHRAEGWLQALMAPFASAIGTSAKASRFGLQTTLDLIRRPAQAIGYLKTGAEVAAELAYLLLMPSDSDTRFKGQPHGVKRVAWSEPLKLSEVKAVAHAVGASINDVLLACVAGALRRYLIDKGDKADGVELRALAPINLRPPGEELSLGNRFGILAVELPVGIEDPMKRLAEVRRRMLELKNSVEPPVTLGLFGALGYAPKYVQDQLFDLLTSRATAVMTYVPGPTEKLTIGGALLDQSIFWVPQSSDIGLGVSILSYGDEVQFGLAADAALTPDPDAVISHFKPEFEAYLYACLLATAG